METSSADLQCSVGGAFVETDLHRTWDATVRWELNAIGIVRRFWLAFAVLLVVLIAGFTVHRLRSLFGSDPVMVVPHTLAENTAPFDPKVVTYQVFGTPGAATDINYLDLDIQPQRVEGATLPWKLTLTTTKSSVLPNVVAQGTSNTIGCRIIVDGEVKDEKISSGVNAQTFCSWNSS